MMKLRVKIIVRYKQSYTIVTIHIASKDNKYLMIIVMLNAV